MPAPPCLFCLRRIYSNSRAITCDKCQRWHYIRCGNTGISEEVYDEAVRNQDELRFVNSIQFYFISYVNANEVPMQCKLIKEKKLQRHQSRQTRATQGRLCAAWDRYGKK
ncbi:hypothetical protein DPMN_109711 [Dreissena polymorpha]|uniref:Uncharacterized protein n=1 Tax=Dreissena polymorpha TaxID=45954 RepID=A0A9D4QM86_DREPO|nr:hypothetical protein DPMN_109711 [Dreissena polymorpha]